MSVSHMSSIWSSAFLLDSRRGDLSLNRQGLLIVCVAPVAMYVLLYGHALHFAALFAFVVVARLVSKFDGVAELKPIRVPVSHSAPNRSPVVRGSSIKSANSGKARVSDHKPSGHHPVPNHSPSSSSQLPRIQSTSIVSADSANTKIRRALLNKISPDRLNEIIVKLVDTFDPLAPVTLLCNDLSGFIDLVFIAASRQPHYLVVYTDLLREVSNQVLASEVAERVLVKRSQFHWCDTCLSSVEKSPGWNDISTDDQVDLRARYRSRQFAIAEFCGVLASYELVPASLPLSWATALMEPILRVVARKNSLPKDSSSEDLLEMVCYVIRGLGRGEAMGILTDLDSKRLGSLCDILASLPVGSSRVRCFLQDLSELRNSNWIKLPSWKEDLVPAKRTSCMSG